MATIVKRGNSKSRSVVYYYEDKETKDKIWRIGDEMYYSKGKEDPDYCVIKFSSISARFYNRFKSVDIII